MLPNIHVVIGRKAYFHSKECTISPSAEVSDDTKIKEQIGTLNVLNWHRLGSSTQSIKALAAADMNVTAIQEIRCP